MNDTNTPSAAAEQAPKPTTHRARWAAIGAAVAVSLGAGGFGIANAVVTENPKNVYVAISPCRLADTRPGADNVGPRSTPLGGNETWTLAGSGDVVGPCNLPTGFSALELNVTAVNATAGSYLTFWPSNVPRPLASNLNPSPGEPATPNSVTVTLAPDGSFSVYNLTGSVDVIIDVVGYYDNHRHEVADISNDPGVSYSFKSAATVLGTNTAVTSTAIRVPSDGFLVLQATGIYQPGGGNPVDQAICQLTLGGTTIDTAQAFTYVTSEVAGNYFQNLSLHRVVPVKVADNPLIFNSGQVVRLLCSNNLAGSAGSVASVELTATFYATEYEPFGLIFLPFAEESVDGNADQG